MIFRFWQEKVKRKTMVKAAVCFFAVIFVCGMISRGIYGATLPKVKTETVSFYNLTHRVLVEGKLEAERENAVYGTEGLRVDQILVEEGERIEAGQTLLQYDRKDLEKIIEERETELQKLQIQIDTLVYNQGLVSAEENKAKERATEDYQSTQFDNQNQAAEAQEALNRARQELESFPTMEDYIAAHQGADGVSANTMGEEWQQKKNALEQTVRDKQTIAEDTKRQNEEAIRQAKRALEDATKPSARDSMPEILQLEEKVLEKEIDIYRALEEEGGLLKSDFEGTVTEILIEESRRVLDGALFRIADGRDGYVFRAQISKEDRKHVTVGDEVSLHVGFGKDEIGGEIVSLKEDVESETYMLTARVNQNTGNPGDRGTLFINQRAEKRSMCIPLSALHQENGVKYVLVCEERQTILGSELTAVKRVVEVTDSNESYASIEEGSLSDQDQIIVDSTQLVEEGDRIRLLDL